MSNYTNIYIGLNGDIDAVFDKTNPTTNTPLTGITMPNSTDLARIYTPHGTV